MKLMRGQGKKRRRISGMKLCSLLKMTFTGFAVGWAGKLLSVISGLQTKFNKMEIKLTGAKTDFGSELIKVNTDLRNESAQLRLLLAANE